MKPISIPHGAVFLQKSAGLDNWIKHGGHKRPKRLVKRIAPEDMVIAYVLPVTVPARPVSKDQPYKTFGQAFYEEADRYLWITLYQIDRYAKVRIVRRNLAETQQEKNQRRHGTAMKCI